MRKSISLFTLITLISVLSLPAAASDEIDRRDYALGWQVSRPSSGLSLKIPLSNRSYLQPVLFFNMAAQDNKTDGHFALGVRALYEFTARYQMQPYIGIGLGHQEDYSGGSLANSSMNQGGDGYEAFFGVEYQRYLLRPALEIGMGGYSKANGSYYAGLTYNLSLFYYF